MKFTFTYYGDALGNPTGGVYQGMAYSGRFATIVDVDLGKIMGWSGATFHVSEHQIHGPGLSLNYLDNLMVASGVEVVSEYANLFVNASFGWPALASALPLSPDEPRRRFTASSGWARRSVPRRAGHRFRPRGHGAARLCPPYSLVPHDSVARGDASLCRRGTTRWSRRNPNSGFWKYSSLNRS